MTKKFEPNKSMNSRFRIFLSLAVLYAFLIFYLSSRSDLGDPKAIFDFMHMESLKNILSFIDHLDLGFLLYPLYIFSKYPDKVEHIALYAGFGFLLYLTLKNSSNPAYVNHAFIFAIIFGIIYGAIDEFHQYFVPGRTASIWDFLTDGIGVIIAQAIILIKNRINFETDDTYIKKKAIKNYTDLNLILILIILSILFILIPPFNHTFIRMVFALSLLLLLPGYLLIYIIFPRHGELSFKERFTMSIGFSIAIVIFDGFVLNYTIWGFKSNSIVISLSILMGLFLILAYYQRWRIGETSYSFSFKNITSFYHILYRKETERGTKYDYDLENTLIKTMVLSIILVSTMLIYAKVTTEPEKFTAFYILGADGKAENYPKEIYTGEPSTILVGVENHEYEVVNYKLVVKLEGRTLKEQEIVLNPSNKWRNNITFIPQLTPSIVFAGANRSKLEFQLLKNNTPYRSVYLLVNTHVDSKNFAPLPNITNGDMESEDGWVFFGSKNITGRYIRDTMSSRVYEINFTAENDRSYGLISQNLTIHGNVPAILSFDVRDSKYSNASYYTYKQVLLGEQVIWESTIGDGNSSWEHVEIPVLLSANATLAFRVYSEYGINLNFLVWWDKVRLRPYSVNRIGTNIIPKDKIYEFKFDVRGAPLTLEKSMKIDGFNFPGFNYDIDENKSFEELDFQISDNNKIDAGRAIYTTIVNGNELQIMGSRYKILSKDMPANLSRIFEISTNKTLNLGEIWELGNGYSLYIKMIGFKGDSAIFELRKDGQTLDSRLIGRGWYRYNTNIGQFSVTIFEAKVDISSENVNLTYIKFNSDDIIALEPGTILGDFEVANISSDEIIFKNIFPFELKNNTVILDNSVGFSLQGNILYPYASGVKQRGNPQNITSGNWMNITGYNYPGFYMGNNTSYEELRMYFSSNGFVDAGQAVYISKPHSGLLSFLGNLFERANSNRPGLISTITNSKKITLYENQTLELGKGFEITFKKRNNNDEIILFIRKSMIKEQQKLLNITENSRLFNDFYYEMLAGKNGTLRKSNILSKGDIFEYWIEYKEDVKYKIIAGELEAINNNTIELNIREYDIPFEISPGKNFGEFEVESITTDAITLRNIKPLRFMPGEENMILNGALKIKTSSKEYIAYPTK